MKKMDLHRLGGLFFGIPAILTICLTCALQITQAEVEGIPPMHRPDTLDREKVQKLYLDGDFDKAIEVLEEFRKTNKKHSRDDSVFIFKHLGVMYAADPANRERGKYFMYQLLNVEPTAKIMDMYASDMIYMIFRNVVEEYQTSAGNSAGDGNQPAHPASLAGDTLSSPGHPVDAHNPSISATPTESNSRRKIWYWAAGGAGLAGATGLFLYLAQDDPDPKVQVLRPRD